MKHIFLTSFFLFALVFCSSLQAQPFAAESAPMPDVLGPAPVIWDLGLQLGMNLNQHTGDFQTQICNCTFANGSGKGVLLGAELSHKFNDDVGFAFKFLYDDKRATYDRRTREETLVLVVDESGKFVSTQLPLDYNNIADVRFSYAVFNPVIEIFPLWGLYILAGPAVGIRLKSTYEYKKSFVDPGYYFIDNDQPENTIESADIPGSESIRIDIRAGLGYNLKLSRTAYFAPEVSFDYPISKISSDDNWFARALHVVGVLKIRL